MAAIDAASYASIPVMWTRDDPESQRCYNLNYMMMHLIMGIFNKGRPEHYHERPYSPDSPLLTPMKTILIEEIKRCA